MTDETISGQETRDNPAGEAAAPLAPAEALAERLASLEARLARHERGFALLNRKLHSLHETLLRMNAREAPPEVNDPLAASYPIERRLRAPEDPTILAFAGQALVPGMPRHEFWSMLDPRPANVFLVKDFLQCAYQQGLLGLSADVPSTAALLRGLLPAGQRRLATMGSSAGGFAAILFGVLLGADRILTFGPQTIITAKVFDHYDNQQSTFADVVKNGRDWLDLAALLRANPGFGGQIRLYYAQDYEMDRVAAARLRGFDCVELVAVPGKTHGVARALLRDGSFGAALDWALG